MRLKKYENSQSNTTGRNCLSYSKHVGRFGVGPSTGVSLSESRGRSVGLGVETGWGGRFTVAGCERVVGVVKVAVMREKRRMALAEAGRYGRREIHVLDSHDKRTTHDVKFMLALQCGSHV